MAETLAEEFGRLVLEYDAAPSRDLSIKNEAWNLLADFSYCHSAEICTALAALEKERVS